MHKSSKTRWSVWSDWIWHEEHQRYYRQRQDGNGNIDYEWDPRGSLGASTTTDEKTPRDPDYEGLAQTLDSTHIQDPSSPASYDHQSSEYTIASGSSKPQKAKSSSKNKPKASKSSSSRSKDKAPASRDDDEDAEQETSHANFSQQPSSNESYYDPETRQYYDYSHPSEQYTAGTTTTYQGSASASTPGAEQYAEPAYAQDEDSMMAAAIADSRRYNYTAHTAGESSSSAYAYDYEDEGPPTPRAGMSHTHISATEGEEEELDPRYRVEPSHKFQPGEIFKVLWCEPQGSANEGTPSISDRFEVRDRFGGRIFVGFRRFIVIANDQGHCTCVPILTYGGKACNKRGVKPEKHGIVYEKGHKTRLLSGEPKLGFAPVKIQMTEDGEKLSKESRVNYSKLVTVEHNVKVLFIGRIVAADWDIVSEAVNRCWEEKIHHKRKHFDR